MGEVPVAHDAGYDEAVALLGGEEVTAAVTNAARAAHIALADCHRWRTGAQDWGFRCERSGDGWRLAEAETDAHVNSAPPRAG